MLRIEVISLEEKVDKIPETDENAKKHKKRTKVKAVFAMIFTAGANMLFLLMLWILNRYDDVQFDQILYQLKSPAKGTGSGLVLDAMLKVVLLGAVIAAVEILFYFFFAGKEVQVALHFFVNAH